MKTWKKWTYGMGKVANTVVQQVFNNRIQFFCIDVIGLNAALELAGEEGYTLAERVSMRPTFEIHGMPGGYTGPGKTR